MNKKQFNYGYIIVAAAVMILIVAYGNFYSYSVFFNSLSSEFNWAKGTTSGVFSIAVLISGVISIFAGRMSDRLGPMIVSIICGISLGLGFILMSQVRSPWQVYLVYGTLIAIGAGGFYTSLASTVARWFTAKRGMMTGIISAGLGIGSVIFAPVIGQLIRVYDWRRAYITIGTIVLVVVVAAAPLLRRRPPRLKPSDNIRQDTGEIHLPNVRELSFKQAIRTGQYWISALIYFLIGYAQLTVLVHIVPQARLYIDPISAAGIISVIGASGIFGRLIIGALSDRIRVKLLLVFIFVFLMSALIGLEFAQKIWAFILAGILFGLSYGGSSTVAPLLTAELFGLRSMGGLFGSLLFSVCLGGSIGPVLSGILVDITDSYRLAILICICAALAGLTLVTRLALPKRKR